MKRKYLCIVCLFIIIIIFIVGLWPFSFHPKNEVEWLQDKNGIHFYGRGITYTPESFDLKSLLKNNSVAFEILLEPSGKATSNTGHILSLYDGIETEIIIFRQWKYNLEIFRNKNIASDKNISKNRIGLRDALMSGTKRLITVSSEKQVTKIYIDGKLAKSYPKFNLILNNEMPVQLILGNSPTGKNPWNGKLFGLAIYNQSLTEDKIFQNYESWLKYNAPLKNGLIVMLFLFDEYSGTVAHNSAGNQHLLIPEKFKVLQKSAFALPSKDFRLSISFFTDVLINILGFIPFGFFLSAHLKNKLLSHFSAYFITIIAGGIISLSIELIQVYLPTRSSSLTDLICNVFGTILGIVLSRYIYRVLP